MNILYSRPGSGGFAAEAVMTLAGVPFDLVNVDRIDPDPAFLAISPLRQIPAMRLADGSILTESAAICIFYADRHPEARLAPAHDAPERADFLRWMLFLTSALYPALLRWFYAGRYTSDPAGIAAVEQAALAEMDRHFAILDGTLEGRDWLAGHAMSIADVYLLMLAHWHPVGDRPRDDWTNIVRVCDRLKTHPAMARLNETHKLW